MMQKVKYVLAFLAGSLYTSAGWCRATSNNLEPGGWAFASTVILMFGGILILGAVGLALAEHWDE